MKLRLEMTLMKIQHRGDKSKLTKSKLPETDAYRDDGYIELTGKAVQED